MKMKTNTKGFLFAVVATLMVSGTAHAGKQLVMSGTWALLNGIQPIPIAAPPTIPSPGVEVSVVGSNPARVPLPQNAFQAFAPVVFPVGVPDVQQLQTSFMVTGPTAVATLEPSGRTGPDTFNWCPGQTAAQASAPGGIGGCATQQSAGQGGTGTFNGIVKYKKGSNKYSAIAWLLLQGTGTLSLVEQVGPPLQIRHVPLGGSGLRVDGGTFGNTFKPNLASAAPVTEPIGVSVGGLITVGGSTVGTVTDLDANTDHGFSLTTGMITITATDVQAPNPTKVMISGTDQRTPKGLGNLVLVSGGLTKRTTPTQIVTFTRTGTMTLSFQQPIPAASPTVVAAGAIALVGIAGFAIRKGRAARQG